jgi:carbon-monoxide dehydrogenase large subunit/6-hydroxypseudooxynicotine dehydrogenase subunit gamma
VTSRQHGAIGARLKRREDPRFLTGGGSFVGDITLPGMLHATVVRSTHAHARLENVDVAAARRMPGVVACFTAADIGDRLTQIPIRLGADPKLFPFLQPPLASERVRYAGEPVAVVVATDAGVAADARDAVRIDYAPLPAVVTMDAAAAQEATALFDGGNVAATWLIDVGDVEGALARAAHVVEERFDVGRQTGLPIETRGLLAHYDGHANVLQMWGPTKVPYFNRAALARMLGLREEQVRFSGADVGGGFGVRGEFYPEDFLIPFAAVTLQRPVRWIEERREHFAAINHSREQRCMLRVGIDSDGRLLAIDAVIHADMGAYLRTHGIWVPALTAAYLPGAYRVPSYRCRVSCLMTNKTPTGTVRGPGVFEGTFARERALDIAALRAGLDPAVVRRRNLLAPHELPHRLSTGALAREIVLEDEDFRAVFDAALAAADYDRVKRECEAANAGAPAVRLGVGMATFIEPSGAGPFETARVALAGDGRIAVDSGATALGQGLETTLAQICADGLGVPVEAVTVMPSDTARLSAGGGTYASRSTIMAGSAVHGAARMLKDKILDAAAAHLEVAAADLTWSEGALSVVGLPERSHALIDVARWTMHAREPADGAEALVAEYRYESPRGLTTFAVHVAVVAVDTETGTVKPLRHVVCCDVGRAVNPSIVEGQLHGGIVLGLGHALAEALVYDEGGQLITGSLMDYAVPVAADCPAIDLVVLEHGPARSNPLGVKGVGETGTSGVGGAIANAVAHALGANARVGWLPLTPSAVREAAIRGRRRPEGV